MQLQAPAKINLFLRVGRPRADGFHPVLTWMTSVALFDTLTFERSHHAGVRLTADLANLPCDAGNLIVKAASALLATGASGGTLSPHGADIRLQKRIPIGAGLGGGSSNAARTLEALNVLWALGLPDEAIFHLAASLGSDVPFFLHGPSAICRGRGEQVQPQFPPRARLALLIFPGRPMPTGPVYRRFDELHLGIDTADEPDWRALAALPALTLLPKLVNDLESAAFDIDPALGRLRSESEQLLGRCVRMSGSGSTLFTLYDDDADAAYAARKLKDETNTETYIAELCPSWRDDLNEPRPGR